jgi:protein-S-isoprenylcysteine O-methyltransferase Ste14
MVATIYLISAFLLLIAAFIIFRIIVRRDYERRGRLTLLSTLLESLIWDPYFGFPYIYNSSSWPAFWLSDQDVNPVLRYAGMILIGVGLAMTLAAMTLLGFGRSLGQEVNVLKQNGLYGLTRNPQIMAGSLMILGIALRWPSWYALGWVILFAVMAHMMVLTEEEHLRAIHGEEFVRYCAQVPRYLGFLKRS